MGIYFQTIMWYTITRARLSDQSGETVIRQRVYSRGATMKRLIMLLLAFLVYLPTGLTAQATYAAYAIGNNNTILQLENGNWYAVDPGDAGGFGNLLDIWGSSGDDIYIASGRDELLHFNGTSWERIPMPYEYPMESEYYYAVNGTGPDNIFVGGYWGYNDDWYGIAYHYNGTEWSFIDSPRSIKHIWADPGGGCYAIVKRTDTIFPHDSQYWVLKYEEGTWSYEPVPVGDYYWDEYYGIGGKQTDHPVMVARSYNPMASTSGGTIFIKKDDSSWGGIWRDGECGLYDEKCPVWPVYWYGVWCVSDTDIWTSGEEGSVLHWTPAGYTEYDAGVTETLRAIWGSSNYDIYAVGDAGTIVHFDGIDWTTMSTPTTENLTDIWGLYDIPVATLLQEFSTDTDEGHITIRWSLSEVDESTEFRVSRSAGALPIPVVDNDPDLERNGLSFTYLDTDVELGADYSYLVEYSDGGGWIMLFDTGRIVVPNASLALMPNYPNPFNPSTRITYSVPENGHVSLKIYDVSGKLVRTIVDRSQAPGTYSVNWNGVNDQGRNAATGTYFCRLVTAKRAITNKMLLTR